MERLWTEQFSFHFKAKEGDDDASFFSVPPEVHSFHADVIVVARQRGRFVVFARLVRGVVRQGILFGFLADGALNDCSCKLAYSRGYSYCHSRVPNRLRN